MFEPSTNIKYASPAPLLFDLGVRFIYNEKLWLGSVYRHKDAVSAMVGFTLKQNIAFVYSYDFTTSNIKNYSTGTHELTIGLKFHKSNPRSAATAPVE